MLWLWFLIFIAVAAFAVYLLVLTARRFARGFRQGLRGDDHAERPTLRSVLFGTVLVTLLVLFLLGTALFEHNQRDQQYPVGDGMTQLRVAQNNGAPWLDQEAQAAIEAALQKGIGGNPAGRGGLNLNVPGMAAGSLLPPSAVAMLRRQGWVVGVAPVDGQQHHYVAWRTTKNDAVYYDYVVPAWYWSLFQYLWTLVFGVAILSPFAAVAAWYLNRRIVKPVQQVADASVVLADGGQPMPIPTKAPRELSVLAGSFNDMAARLRRAQDTERDFLLSVGHELKTPLTAIDGYAELLADGAVEPQQAAEVLTLESARLRRLIGDLLDLARIDRSEFSVLDDEVDLAVTAAEVRERFETLAATLGVTLQIDAPEPAPARGDGGRLLQVASNLVENALRVTPSGGQVRVVARPGLLEVSDTGPGLSAEDLEHAFERFYLHRKYSGPEVGTGLGLAIVKELAEAMGGDVGAVSEPGVGSTFRVRLRSATTAVLQEGRSSVSKAHSETVQVPAVRSEAGHAWAWFAVWLVVGGALAFSVVDGLAFGLLVLPFAIVAVMLLIARHHFNRSAWGLLCGAGLLLLYVAYVQRKGPGTVSWHTATASGADTYMDPRPWLVAGLLLIVVGIIAFLWHRRGVTRGVAR
jgi:signal transduction histidine kinase